MAFSRGIGALALSVALSVSVPAFAGDEPPEHQVAAPTKELTVVSWGGAYTRSQMLAYVKPYRLLSGEWVSMETYNGGLEEIREQVETENVTWDVVDFILSDLIRGCREGLLEEIDHGTLPPGDDGTAAADDFIPGAFTPCGVGQTVWSTVVGYDTEAVGESAPSTLADFFDVDAFPGKRGLRRDPRVILEWALIADGATPSDVYALLETEDGLDRAFSVMDEIKNHIEWWEAGADPIRLLDSDEVVMTSVWNGRMYRPMVEDGKPYAILLGRPDLGYRLLGHPKGQRQPAEGHGLHSLRDEHGLACRADEVHLIRPGATVLHGAGRRRDQAAPAHRAGQPRPRHADGRRMVGHAPGRADREIRGVAGERRARPRGLGPLSGHGGTPCSQALTVPARRRPGSRRRAFPLHGARRFRSRASQHPRNCRVVSVRSSSIAAGPAATAR